MEVEITNKERNELLSRDEYDLAITHTGDATPSQHDVRKHLAASEDLDMLTIEIESIYSSSGRGSSVAHVRVHDEPVISEDDLPEEGAEDASDEEADTEADESAADEDASEETEDAEEDESEADDAGEESDDADDDADEETADEDEEKDE